MLSSIHVLRQKHSISERLCVQLLLDECSAECCPLVETWMIARDGTMEMVRGQVFLQAQGAYHPFCADLLTLNRSIHHAPLCQPTVMLVANASHLWKPQSPQRLPGQSADFERMDRTESGGSLLGMMRHASRMRSVKAVVRIGDHAEKIREARSAGLVVWESIYTLASP